MRFCFARNVDMNFILVIIVRNISRKGKLFIVTGIPAKNIAVKTVTINKEGIMKKITKKEYSTISKIANRAAKIASKQGANYDYLTASMDIEAVHKNIMPLKLNELLKADNFNFTHDVFGIANHLNRETIKLENCFVPRYAQ